MKKSSEDVKQSERLIPLDIIKVRFKFPRRIQYKKTANVRNERETVSIVIENKHAARNQITKHII